MKNINVSEDVKLSNCKLNDKVYLYSKELFKGDFTINTDMIGYHVLQNIGVTNSFLHSQYYLFILSK